ncbi:ComF family protein [Lentzea sp. NPDC060358]|uniref:ComF family protein n=1 Tax=Lentzea sp. NPDC060358 TaxID=3347103 RepID=UPI00365D9248
MSPLSRILDSYRNFLVPPPARGQDVCVTCRRATDGFKRCWQCNRHHQAHGTGLADEVVPISMAEKDKQLMRALSQYKNSTSDEVRRRFTNELASVLATFLAKHQDCLGGFDLVTVVPSSQGRTSPLVDVLERRISRTSARFARALTTESQNTREMRPDSYDVVIDVREKSVLLVDDTWTSGASLQSAAVALKRAGSARVVGLVIGRYVDEPVAGVTAPFDWETCTLCA